MEQNLQDRIGEIVTKDTWSAQDHEELLKELAATHDAAKKFRAVLGELESQNPQPSGAPALKIGIARYMLCRFAEALEALSAATDNKDRRYFQAQCYKNLRQYDKALEEIARAKDRGWDAAGVDVEAVELQAMSGDVEGASKAFAKLKGKAADTADYHYVRGLIDELAGNTQQATEAYEQARRLQPGHPNATFRLAYCLDLYGDEEQAIELYKECVAGPPVHANALLNLAVLYEDTGLYEQSGACLRRILMCNPNHRRARLFFKDVQASKTMFFDEDQARRIARRNAVLDIPITDFELSVRARNCLKKMNIRTLGDLVRTSEAELLGYKNFGETSLKEIKDMLSVRGLRLGQALEEPDEFAQEEPFAQAEVNNEGVLATPIEQIEFSVRARRALETLRLKTLGDLVSKSEPELLACKNFGQTSLNEVRQRLGEYGMKLREPN